MKTYLWIAIGSALGGTGRFLISNLLSHAWGDRFPWPTILVNISGSFIMGACAALLQDRPGPEPFLRYFCMIGVCGGYTTFSAFSLQTLDLIRNLQWAPAIFNVVVSVVACLMAVGFGYALGRHWAPR